MKFHLPLPGRRLRRILTLLGQAALCCVLTAARLGGLYAPFSLAAATALLTAHGTTLRQKGLL